MVRGIRLLAALLAITGLALAPGVAQAKKKHHTTLLNTKTKLIVPGASLAGASIGQATAKAEAAWGIPPKTCAPVSCVWQNAAGVATLGFNSGKVTGLRVTIAFKGGKPLLTSPLTKLKTAKGIGLGSTAAALTAAYPELTKGPTSHDYANNADVTLYVSPTGDQRSTKYGVSGGKVVSIDIQLLA